MKPLIELGDFQRLDLRVGTVTETRRLEQLDLAAARVDAGQPFDALLPGRVASGLGAGSRVVVAVGLHPLTAGGSTFTAFVIAALTADLEEVPNGSRVS